MKATNKNKNRKKWIYVSIVLIAILFLLGYHFFYHPKVVNSDYAKIKFEIKSHGDEVWAVKYHPDGKAFISASVDSTAKVFSATDGRLLQVIKHPAGLTYVAFNSTGDRFATSSYDGIVRLYNYPESRLLFEMKGHLAIPRTLDFSPAENILISGSDDGSLIYWDTKEGRLLRTVKAHDRTVWDVKFSPDGKTLVSGSFDFNVKIWNPSDGRLLKTITDHTEAVVALAFSRDGKLLASTSDDKSIRIWNTVTWKTIQLLKQPEHPQAVSFSLDGKRLMTGGRDKTTLGEFTQTLFGSTRYNKGVSMRLWDIQSGAMIQTFRDNLNDVNEIIFSPSGNEFVTGSSDKTIKVYQIVK